MAVAALLVACDHGRIADTDEVYFRWDDRRVLCGAGIDDVRGNDVDNITEGIARAAARGEVLVLYGHEPGRGHSLAKLEAIMSAATELGVPLVSFEDLMAPGGGGPGLALGFDDAAVDAWYETRGLLARYRARVTYFVTRFDRLSDARVDRLRALRADGHAIEAHGLRHRDGPEYRAHHGLQAYMNDEVIPSLDVMRAAGFSPRAFAYPFGARTGDLDRAILEHVRLVRSVTFLEGIPGLADPCPE